MHICSAVVLSYLDAGFEAQCPRKDFFAACLLLLLATAKMFSSSSEPEHKNRKPSWAIKTQARTELGLSLA